MALTLKKQPWVIVTQSSLFAPSLGPHLSGMIQIKATLAADDGLPMPRRASLMQSRTTWDTHAGNKACQRKQDKGVLKHAGWRQGRPGAREIEAENEETKRQRC